MADLDDDGWTELPTAGLTDAPARRGFTLRVVGEDFAFTHELPRAGRVVVGRGEGCEVQINHPSVSRRHALIHLGARPRVEDLGSANGTRVGRRPLAVGHAVEICAGDVIDLGSILLVLHAGAPAPVADAPTAAERAPMIVADEAARRVQELVERVAPTNMSVLLLGETGAGKEIWAEALHRLSRRADRPLVRLNCAALPEQLLESELFGYERGAFTGADQAKPGLLETADGGTVLLDEIGELALPVQAKLLRVIEDRKVLRVGSVKPHTVDVRLVSATNRDLEREVEAGRFRRDLFFRLNGITIAVPPLRARPGDVEALARAFVTDAANELGRAAPALTPAAIAALRAHAWPGNVRELKNVIARAVLLAGDHIGPVDLGLGGAPAGRAAPSTNQRSDASAAPPLSDAVAAVERERILAVLERCGGNQTRAARELGISRNTLAARLRAYGVPRPRSAQGKSPKD